MEVYRLAPAFVWAANVIRARLPPGRSALTDQLDGAALSIARKIAQGGGELSEKAFRRTTPRFNIDLRRLIHRPVRRGPIVAPAKTDMDEGRVPVDGYPAPTLAFGAIRGYFAFYAGSMEACYVDGEGVTPQAGGFYGGWITRDIVGPFKGGPGTAAW